MKRSFLLKAIPKWAVFGLAGIVLAFFVFIFRLAYSSFLDYDRLAKLSIVSGEVIVSDGITDVEANDGAFFPRNVRTLLKTNEGTAYLSWVDGSIVIIDSDTTIEFNRLTEYDPWNSFAFNLVKGRVLVIKEVDSQSPTQALIGGDIAVRVFQAAMGLEVTTEGAVQKRVDCLIGQCLVNGVNLLLSGQYAQIGSGGAVEVTDGFSGDRWVTLEKAGSPNPSLSNLLASSPKSIEQTPVLKEINQTFQVAANSIAVLDPDFTLQPPVSPDATSTVIPLSPTYHGTFSSPEQSPSPIATPIFTWYPLQTITLVQSQTPLPGNTPFSTFTSTSTLTPTNKPPLILPSPQPTPTPEPPPASTPTHEPTLILPSPQPTTTPEPPPSSTPTKVPTLIPSPQPTLTPELLPTSTPTRHPTKTPKPH